MYSLAGKALETRERSSADGKLDMVASIEFEKHPHQGWCLDIQSPTATQNDKKSER
jgi:hypothetical protein